MRNRRLGRVAVLLFFLAYLILGVVLHRDYGVSWDETAQRVIGIHTFDYVFRGDPALLSHEDRYYGAAFEVVLVGLERLLGLSGEPRAIHFLRHLVTFLVFYAGLIAFYRLGRERFRSAWLAGLGCLFLALNPRIFAHAFFNSKDIPALALFVIAVLTLLRFLRLRTPGSAALHALASALLIDVRIPGVMIYAMTLGFFVLDTVLRPAHRGHGRRAGAVLLFHTVVLVALVVLFRPILWTDPVGNFVAVFRHMSHYPMKAAVLYLGEFLLPREIPWHYIPVWIGITTPLVVLGLFLAGCGAVVGRVLRRPLETYRRQRDDLVFLVWFFGPLLAVILLGSALYDGWRQMYFVYPALVLLALRGLHAVRPAWRALRRRLAGRAAGAGLALLVAGQLVWLGSILIRYHPHQQVYFNRLAGPSLAHVKPRFDLDYWGVSYRQALEHLVANDSRNEIRVYVDNLAGLYNVAMLDAEDQKRLRPALVPERADYFLSNYRHRRGELPYRDMVFAIVIDGARIMVVYRMAPGP